MKDKDAPILAGVRDVPVTGLAQQRLSRMCHRVILGFQSLRVHCADAGAPPALAQALGLWPKQVEAR
jgi:hypothetical protein